MKKKTVSKMKTNSKKEDPYKELKEATPEELLEALLFWSRIHVNRSPPGKFDEDTLRMGFALAQKDGWEHVAPKWLRDYRNMIRVTAP